MATDSVHDILKEHTHPLDVFFSPRHVAVIGASETVGSVGRTLLWNLISSPFGGVVYPVNPKRTSVLGIKAYPSIDQIPAKIDLAIIVTPSATVPSIVRECVRVGVSTAIIISAGFKELGTAGIALEKEILLAAQDSNLRIIGPNCLGVMSPVTGFNGTFAKNMAKPGHVAFLSQSGALLTAVLDWGLKEKVGFRACVSLGSMLDISWGDLIDYFGSDPATHSILIYMESIGDARSFLSAARAVALNKPIIVIKAGRTSAAAIAASSHTGAMAGSDEVLDAAFERVGVLRVNTICELFDMASILSKQPRPRGPKLSIITNAGGPAVLATDALIQSGGQLAPLSDISQQTLNQFLPSAWSHNNPIDILGDADATRYEKTLDTVAKDPESDGLLVILTPQDMTDCLKSAEKLVGLSTSINKPVLASWMGGDCVSEACEKLNGASIPTFAHPDTAAKAFSYMWKLSENLKSIYETPTANEDIDLPENAAHIASKILKQVTSEKRTLLSELESKQLLHAYGLPTPPIKLATTPQEAMDIALEMGWPVAVKLHSYSITHKTDVGGVRLGLLTPEDVARSFHEIQASTTRLAGPEHFQGVTVQPMITIKDSYELILGSTTDAQFGRVIMCGAGGQLVEVFKDYKLGLPPLNTTLAKRLLEKTKIYKALLGIRGRQPICMQSLEKILVSFSQLVLEHPMLAEIEINPLLVGPSGMMVLDARIAMHPADAQISTLSAIRPYPKQYIFHHKLKNDLEVFMRPIRPEDEPLVIQFHQELSERSINLRFFTPLALHERTTHERMVRICCSDYEREICLLVQKKTRNSPIMALGRLSRLPIGSASRMTLLVSDRWQGLGLGSALVKQLLTVAKAEKLVCVYATISQDNVEMKHICTKFGFTLSTVAEGKVEAIFKIEDDDKRN